MTRTRHLHYSSSAPRPLACFCRDFERPREQAALIRILNDPAFARRVGERALADARGPYAWTTIADKILARL